MMHFVRYAAAFLFALVAADVSSAGDSALVTIDGQRLPAKFVGIDHDGRFAFDADGAEKTLAFGEFLRWGSPVESREGRQIVGADGSLWVADETYANLQIAADVLSCDTVSLGEVKLPIDTLRGIIFRPSDDSLRYDHSVAELFVAKEPTDTVVLDNGDRVQGTVTGLAEQRLKIQTPDGDIARDVRQSLRLILNPALVARIERPRQWLLVHFADGSRVAARSWAAKQGVLNLTTVAGQTMAAELDQVAALQTFGPHVKYLSDLKVSSYHYRPFLSLQWPYAMDRNTLGGRLRCGGRLYEKGIGVHSVAGLTFALDQPYKRFETSLGIDDATGGGGSVVFRFYVDDGRGKWTPKFESDVVRGGDAPVPVSIDVTSAKRLSVIVDLADRGDEQDHAVLLDARLVP